MLPPAFQEWFPPNHLAYFMSYVVDQLDLSAIAIRYQGEERGGPPCHPRMMVKVLLYSYCTGAASSRRVARCFHEDVAFRRESLLRKIKEARVALEADARGAAE